MMESKGKSMSLKDWRERCGEQEELARGYWLLWKATEAKLAEQKRISQSNRSKKNHWKRKAEKLAKEVDTQKAMRQCVENMNDNFAKIAKNDAQTIVSWTDIAKAKMLESEKNKRYADILGLTWLIMLIIEMWK